MDLTFGLLFPCVLQVLAVSSQLQNAKKSENDISDFKSMITTKKQMYIDKSLFIQEVMNCPDDIVLITRPPKFGKTLALSTLESFFSKDSQQLFTGLDIMKNDPDLDKLRNSYMGNHPVIRLDFSDVRRLSYQQSYAAIQKMISKEFSRHQYIMDGKSVLKGTFEAILNLTADAKRTAKSISWLSGWVKSYHNQSVIILIDACDTPIQSGVFEQYHTKMVAFLSVFLDETLNKNPHRMKAVIFGVLPTIAEVLSNSPVAYTIFDAKFATLLGFTRQDVEKLAKRTNKENALDKIDAMFDGYDFAGSNIFNPAAVTKYLFEDKVGGWADSKSLRLLEALLLNAGLYPVLTVQLLFLGEPVTEEISKGLSLPDVKDHEKAFWSCMIHSGYLTGNTVINHVGGLNVTLRFPNLEVRTIIALTIENFKKSNTTINYAGFLYNMINMDLASTKTIGKSSLTVPDYKQFISYIRHADWNEHEYVGRYIYKIPNYKSFIDDVIGMDLPAVRDTIDYYLKNAGVYFKQPKQDIHPTIFTKYVVKILRGAELRLNRSVRVIRLRQGSLVSLHSSNDDPWSARPVSKDTPKNEVDLKVIVQRCENFEMHWTKLKKMRVFSRPPKKPTLILILYSKDGVITSLEEIDVRDVLMKGKLR